MTAHAEVARWGAQWRRVGKGRGFLADGYRSATAGKAQRRHGVLVPHWIHEAKKG